MKTLHFPRLPVTSLSLATSVFTLFAIHVDASAQSPTLNAFIPPSAISRPGLVGFQQSGYAIGYTQPTPSSWQELIDSQLPGYRLRTNLALSRIEQQFSAASTPHLNESIIGEEWNYQLVVIGDRSSSIALPEGLFTSRLAASIHPRDGDVLVRIPLSAFVESEPVATIDPPDGFPALVSLQTRGRQISFATTLSHGTSASSLLFGTSLHRDGSESTHSPKATNQNLLEQSLLEAIPSYIVVERLTNTTGPIALILPTANATEANASYYDSFLSIPIRASDRIYLFDELNLQRYLREDVSVQIKQGTRGETTQATKTASIINLGSRLPLFQKVKLCKEAASSSKANSQQGN